MTLEETGHSMRLAFLAILIAAVVGVGVIEPTPVVLLEDLGKEVNLLPSRPKALEFTTCRSGRDGRGGRGGRDRILLGIVRCEIRVDFVLVSFFLELAAGLEVQRDCSSSLGDLHLLSRRKSSRRRDW